MQDKMDLICPIYWMDENYFGENVTSWGNELPIKNIHFGINNPDLISFAFKLMSANHEFNVINQTNFKTLGMCLADLMKCVTTEWFAYVHTDALLTPYCFKVMKQYMKMDNVGIIESERRHWDGKVYKCPENPYYYIARAYSGFQIIRKAAIESILDKVEDDFIYRNEDLIFQAECIKNGYKYQKSYAMHIHRVTNTERTYDDQATMRMQVLGLIKYTDPTPRNKVQLERPLYYYLMMCDDYGKARNELIEFVKNSNWSIEEQPFKKIFWRLE